MNNKKKIAVIGLKGLPAFGGAAAVGENIIEQLKQKYEFTVYSTASHTDKKTGNYNGYKQIVFNKIPLRKINSLYYYIVSLIHSLFIGHYDLVHLHHRDAAFIIPVLKLKYQILLTVHGFGTYDLSDKWNKYKLFFDMQERYFVKMADKITTMSREDKNLIERKLGVSVKYIPNGIDPNGSIQKTLKSDYIMFAAGRIVSFKRCDIFLMALKKINYKGKIIIAGKFDGTDKYKQQLLYLSKELDVIFLGLIKDKRLLLQYFADARLFVFPSSREAMSMVLLEVASVKTPMICSDIPGNTNVFNDEEVLFFKVDHVNALSEKILWALDNPHQMKNKAEKARDKLKTNFNWNGISKEYSILYDSLISNSYK